ncbi:MAG: type II toxin-antitoxin system antitoxin SocA domain-containing protein [Candidatus Zixiibacteriota bacterium]
MGKFERELGERIKQLREQVGMTQGQLANKLGIPAHATISQMETGKRKITVEELRKISRIFGVSIGGLLQSEKAPDVVLREKREVRKTQPRIRISVPQKNLKKFKEVLLYILNKVGSKPNIGETVVYKLLYFIDFDHYELYEEQLMGATYQKNLHGPTPIEFKKIVDRMIGDEEIDMVHSKYFDFPQRKYLPLRPADLSELSAQEVEVIDSVLSRLSDMNAKQISRYSHNDVPWLTTEDDGIIEYESVFYRTAPYSVRQYDEDIQ